MKTQKMNQFLDFQEAIISINQQTQLKGGSTDAAEFIVEDEITGL